jgi:protein-S-isoprenylcysteine O-methyltransferase Ste14
MTVNLRAKAVIEAILFLALTGVALPALAVRALPRRPLGTAGWVFGALLAAAGFALGAWCIALFVTEGGGTQSPRQPPRRLVTSGPYAHVRNPMLLGLVLMLCGEALAFGSAGIAAYALAVVALTSVLMVAVEEPSLTRRFGPDYEAYRRRVPRWLPRPSRSAR